MKCLSIFLMLLCSLTGITAQPLELRSAESSLRLIEVSPAQYGLRLQFQERNDFYEQVQPLALEIVDQQGSAQWLEAAYASVEHTAAGALICRGTTRTINGSEFAFIDIYRVTDNSGTFEVNRSVSVLKADARDKGFSTRFAFQRSVPSEMSDYDFFVPSIWYLDNKDVSDKALASDLSDNDYWFREDRLPLPLIMLRQKESGLAFSLFHKDANGATFKEEDGLNRIIDARMKFASIGVRNKQHPLVGMLYPGTEGERTGIYGMQNERRWAYRSHPIQVNFRQEYTAAFRISLESDYTSALRNTWNIYYGIQRPSYYQVDLSKIYHQHIAILDKYWRSINNSAGVPFRIKLHGNALDEDYNWNMGFVGQAISNASLMIREAFRSGNKALQMKGEQMVDFWANQSLAGTGIPRTWYDPYPQTWRQTPSHLRTVGDGMNGLLWAWNFEKKHGIYKSSWLKTAASVADWLLSVQNSDGSFYQQFDFNNGVVVNDTRNNTSNVIPFLVDIYLITGKEKYKTAALQAGDFIYLEIYQKFRYAGGAADNPNVPDKEAISMALRAFLALYDVSRERRWIDASHQAASYYQTWVYAWPVPIPPDDERAVFPRSRDVTGLSVIATGNNAADSYAAVDAFNIYRVYLYSGDESLLSFSKLLLQNTKQYVNWDPTNPLPGFAPGFLGEAMTVVVPRGHGVDYYLPWQTFNLLEPLVQFEDVFGTYNIGEIQALSTAEREAKHAAYSINRGFEKGTVATELKPQTISFSYFPVKTMGDPDFVPEASASSMLPLAFSSSDPAVAVIENGKVRLTGPGKTTITASQSGNGEYQPATPVMRELAVQPKQVIASSNPGIGKALSPNGDGVNDVLWIEALDRYTDTRLTVFNRQGKKVFETAAYNNQTNFFSGRDSKGQMLPQGSYFYSFSFTEQGRHSTVSGYVVIRY